MAHHDSTPQTVLDAPAPKPDPVWTTTVIGGTTSHPTRSRKGRKVRR